MSIKIEDYLDYAKNLCGKERRYYAHGSDYDDLVSEAYLALVKAVDTWDESRVPKFSSYLGWKVKCAIIDYKRRQLNLRNENNKSLEFVPYFSTKRKKCEVGLNYALSKSKTIHDGELYDPTLHDLREYIEAIDLADVIDGIDLPVDDRDILRMRYDYDMKYHEIAKIFEVSESCICKRIKGIIKHLRKIIK